jgi:hypothetical protein
VLTEGCCGFPAVPPARCLASRSNRAVNVLLPIMFCHSLIFLPFNTVESDLLTSVDKNVK